VIKAAARFLFRKVGLDVRFARADAELPPDLDEAERQTVRAIQPYTLTSVERIVSLVQATRFIVRARVPGAIVECGVWKGGSMMAAARTLLEESDRTRDLYLYDTFEGMSEPTDADRTADDVPARDHLARAAKGTGYWCEAPLAEVQRNLESVGYPADRIHYVKGKVEDTIPRAAPSGPIALLRLDTDWYESTRHELTHLYPRLSPGGILIIDDYGHWTGARRAVDEYFDDLPESCFLHRVDYTGRLVVKR
jgi:hypothetical protein